MLPRHRPPGADRIPGTQALSTSRREKGDAAHSTYNALIRRLVSFERAAACELADANRIERFVKELGRSLREDGRENGAWRSGAEPDLVVQSRTWPAPFRPEVPGTGRVVHGDAQSRPLPRSQMAEAATASARPRSGALGSSSQVKGERSGVGGGLCPAPVQQLSTAPVVHSSSGDRAPPRAGDRRPQAGGGAGRG